MDIIKLLNELEDLIEQTKELGMGIAVMVNILNPDRVVLGMVLDPDRRVGPVVIRVEEGRIPGQPQQ